MEQGKVIPLLTLAQAMEMHFFCPDVLDQLGKVADIYEFSPDQFSEILIAAGIKDATQRNKP